MSKIYYEETLKSGEYVLVTDSCIKYKRNYRKEKCKTIPLDTITQVSKRRGWKPRLNQALFNALNMACALSVGGVLFDLIDNKSVIFSDIIFYFLVGFVLAMIFTFLFNPFAKGVYVVGNDDYIWVSTRYSFINKKECNRLMETINTAIEENK